jgi:hypothetical protein
LEVNVLNCSISFEKVSIRISLMFGNLFMCIVFFRFKFL